MDKGESISKIQRLGAMPEIDSLSKYRGAISVGISVGKIFAAWEPHLFPASEHVADMHKCAFLNVYPWAGEFRKGRTGEELSSGLAEPASRIVKSIDELKSTLEQRFSNKLDTDGKLSLIAFQLAALHAIRPFRTGNTRVATALSGVQVEKLFGIDMGVSVDANEYNKALRSAHLGKGVVPLRDLIRSGLAHKSDIERSRDRKLGKTIDF